jgi:hypothetical protein
MGHFPLHQSCTKPHYTIQVGCDSKTKASALLSVLPLYGCVPTRRPRTARDPLELEWAWARPITRTRRTVPVAESVASRGPPAAIRNLICRVPRRRDTGGTVPRFVRPGARCRRCRGSERHAALPRVCRRAPRGPFAQLELGLGASRTEWGNGVRFPSPPRQQRAPHRSRRAGAPDISPRASATARTARKDRASPSALPCPTTAPSPSRTTAPAEGAGAGAALR